MPVGLMEHCGLEITKQAKVSQQFCLRLSVMSVSSNRSNFNIESQIHFIFSTDVLHIYRVLESSNNHPNIIAGGDFNLGDIDWSAEVPFATNSNTSKLLRTYHSLNMSISYSSSFWENIGPFVLIVSKCHFKRNFGIWNE